MYLFYHASKTATNQHVFFLRPENSGTSHRWQWAVENAAANEASFVTRPAQCAMAQPSPYVTCSGGPDVPGSIWSTGPDRRESKGPKPRQDDGYRQFSAFFWLLLVHTAHCTQQQASNSDPSMRGALFIWNHLFFTVTWYATLRFMSSCTTIHRRSMISAACTNTTTVVKLLATNWRTTKMMDNNSVVGG